MNKIYQRNYRRSRQEREKSGADIRGAASGRLVMLTRGREADGTTLVIAAGGKTISVPLSAHQTLSTMAAMVANLGYKAREDS